jgi:hypothetical protein
MTEVSANAATAASMYFVIDSHPSLFRKSHSEGEVSAGNRRQRPLSGYGLKQVTGGGGRRSGG